MTYVVSLQRQKSYVGHDTRLLLCLSCASHDLVLCTTQEIENKQEMVLLARAGTNLMITTGK